MADQVDDAVAELRTQFRGPLPATVEGIAPASARDLAEALRSARNLQAVALGSATEESLRQLPRVLRVVVRKVLGL